MSTKPIKGKSLKDFKDIHNPDADVVYLRQRIADLETKQINQKKELGEALELANSVGTAIKLAKPVKLKYIPNTVATSPCTHVLHLTDLHYGATTKKDEVDGFGEFNTCIAKERISALASNIINNTIVMRNGYNIPNLHIIGTGDYISGNIHKELEVSNDCPAPVQAIECGYMLGEMFMTFAPYFEKITVDVVTLDNHGRLTVKPQATGGGENNWGYIVAHVAKQHCIKQENIEIRVHAKATALVKVECEKYLAFHGHQIKGWAGKPYYGFDRRVAMEAVKRMGVPETAFTKLLLGHFHHAMNGDSWMLGGSLSGTDAFDHGCGRHSKPHQTSWMVHPRFGEFAWTRWWL